MHKTMIATFEAVLDTASAFARDELRPVALHYDETEEYPRRAAAPRGRARAHLLRPARRTTAAAASRASATAAP